jgi:Aminopeptidase N
MSLIHRMRHQRIPDVVVRLLLSAACILSLACPALAAEKPRIQVQDYVIDAELAPKTHHLTAKAKVKFTALEDISTAVFELNNALRVTRVTNEAGKALQSERVTQDYTIRVTLPEGLSKDQSQTLTFEYEGTLATGDDSPVEGLKLAYIGSDTSYLLYAGRWFPMVGYGTNRFTAAINVTVPAFFEVIGSGAKATATHAAAAGNRTFSFAWETPSFPGTIIAGTFVQAKIGNMNVYFKPNHKQLEQPYSETAEKEIAFFSNLYGPLPSVNISIVELPDDTVPSTSAPLLAAIASRGITEKVNYRLLANNLAHQWWGDSVSPENKDDFWITEGAARDSEVRYVQDAAGEAGFEEATKDMAVGALASTTFLFRVSAGSIHFRRSSNRWSPTRAA